MSNEQEKKLNIKLDENIAEGIYANLTFIAHSDAEFIVDFINMMPGTKQGKVKSRIILTPQHAKRMLMAMQENIKKYEEKNGTIPIKKKNSSIPMNFNGITGEA